MSHQPPFPDFAALNAYLSGLGLFRMVPGLDRMQTVLRDLSLTRPPYVLVQVVGTNGKGSTSTMLAALAGEHGLRVGLHTSPHFLSVRERVRLDGGQLPETAWTTLANTLMAAGGETLSYFEFITCLAVLAFAEANVDLAVMESGLGGSFDATTALEADLVLFTPIGLDHQSVLGQTLREIAADKAGAIRPGKPALSAPQQPAALRELARVAADRQAPLFDISPPSPHDADAPNLALAGEHQQMNASLALAAWRHLCEGNLLLPSARSKVDAAIRNTTAARCETAALEKTWLPGRMQAVAPVPAGTDSPPGTASLAGATSPAGPFTPCSLGWPPLLLDGAHNSHGLAALGLSLAKAGIAPLAVIFTCLADKDLREILPHLRALATGPVIVPPITGNPRAMPPEELAALIGLNAMPARSLEEALELAAKHMADRMPEVFDAPDTRHPLLICGSLYLLGEFFVLRPDCLAPPPVPERS